MKKIVGILVLLLMFSGCFGTDTGNGQNNSENKDKRETATIAEDVVINQFYSDKSLIKAGEQINLTGIITNKSNSDYDYSASVDFGTWKNSVKLVSYSGIGIIKLGETQSITWTYEITQSFIIPELNISTEFMPKLSITLTKDKLQVKPVSTQITIYSPENARVKVNYIEVLTGGASGVTPGQSGIKIRYNFTNKSKNRIYVKKLTPKFYTSTGKDVTSEWLDSTEQDIVNNLAEPGATFSIVRTYTLSNNATAGDVFVDTAIEGVLGDAFGVTAKDDKAETVGKIKVLKVGSAALNAWIALPFGAKSGTMATNQEVTIFATVDYDGEPKASDVGNLEIFYDEIGGAELIAGIKNQGFDLNKQYSWTIKTGSNPIAGNVYVRVTKKPQMTLNNSDSGTVVNKDFIFTKESVDIPITIIEKSCLVMEAGVEQDTYGAVDGVVKGDTDFKVYVIAKNGNANKLTGNVRIKIDYIDFDGMKLSPEEVNFKDVPIDTKAVFSLRAPPNKGLGMIHFTMTNIPIDPITGEQVSNINNQAEVKVKSTLGGLFSLQSVTCDMSTIKSGRSGIPIRFELANIGNEPVKITDLKAVFTQKEVDVSDRWELVSTNLRGDTLLTEENNSLTCVAYYRLKENTGDGKDLTNNVTISGIVTAVDLTSGEPLVEQHPRYNCVVEIKD